jgi:hypothetical protein
MHFGKRRGGSSVINAAGLRTADIRGVLNDHGCPILWIDAREHRFITKCTVSLWE